MEATANSIKEFGWQQPLVVDRDHVIIVGHTRLKAAEKLGLKKVPVVVADGLSEEQVKAYRLADNKTGELSDWDIDMLDIELGNIEELDMGDFGFDIDEEITDTIEDQDVEIKGEGSLNKDFIVPPFSIIDLTRKEVLDRKKIWKNLIKDDGSSRGGATVYNSDTFKSDKYKESSIKISDTSVLDPVLCELINHWFLPTGTCLKTFDCFSGDTSFGFVSSYLGNQFTGIELRQQQVDFNQSRVDEFGLNAKYIQDDGQNVADHIAPNSQDLLFSCPPYYDLEVYSDDPKDASNQESYEDFLKILENAFTASVNCLKDNRFAAIVVGNFRDKKGYERDFTADIVRIFENAGMHFYNDIILQTPLATARLRARKIMTYRKVVKVHQNLLVFYKGDNFKNLGKEFEVIDEYDDLLEGYEDGSEDL